MARMGNKRRSMMDSWPVLARIKAVLRKKMVREFLAEFLSTYVMMVFGLGSVAHNVLTNQKQGSYLGVNLGFGFGVTMGVHMAGSISGAHMNAAVTFTSCALGRVPWKKFPVYVLGQCLGSFMAAATTYMLFYTAIQDFSGGLLTVSGPKATAGIFATYLPGHMTLWRGFLDEVFLTGMLQLCLFAITDKKNNPALSGTEALVTGILICLIGVSLGMNSGYAINPSRDLPPRFFTFMAGWGRQVFRPHMSMNAILGIITLTGILFFAYSAGDNWWWVPVVAPPLGAYIGGIVYLIFTGCDSSQEPQRMENSVTFEDHKITILSKNSPTKPALTPVSVNPASVQPAKPSGSLSLTERF